jgi:TPR repeat protein
MMTRFLTCGLVALLLAALLQPARAEVAMAVPTACDLLAAHPSDPDRIVAGVSASVVRQDLPAVIQACRLDVERYPEVPRLVYYLGRVLFYAGDFRQGLGYVDRAAAMGHRQSQFVSALIYFDGVPEAIEPDACRALGLWRDAAARGHYAASLTVARHALAKRFVGCEGVPAAAEMHEWVAAAATLEPASDYYHGLLNALLLELLSSEES